MKQRYPIILLLILFSLCSHSQNLTGTWLGIYNDYKIVIIQKGDSLFGYTYDTGMGFCQANFVGHFDRRKRSVKGVNTTFIKKTAMHTLGTYALQYNADPSGTYLRGTMGAKGTAMKIVSFGMREPVAYKKVSSQVDSTEFMISKFTQTVPTNAPANIETSVVREDSAIKREPTTAAMLTIEKEKRTTNLFKRIETSADSITLRLYDNGTIDNDTVTVFYNGKIILNRLGLTASIVEIKIAVNESVELQKIELMANNLGSIPPNTANLEILAGRDKYTLRVSADLNVNAGIEVLHKKE